MLCEISQTEKDNTAQYNLYVESQKKKKEVLLIETESRMMAARDWEVGKQGEAGKRYRLSVMRLVRSKDLMRKMVTIVDNTIVFYS